MLKAILFDLDGTLTESGEGIIRSVQYALEKMGKPEPEAEKLRVFVGPPLIEQFMKYSGFNSKDAEAALKFYRERYSTIGIFENKPYAGIPEMLQALKRKEYLLAVASSKPEPFVLQVLKHFEMTGYFDEIVGATMDEKRTGKAEVIEETLCRLGMKEQRSDILMVGDKEHDVLGAGKCGIECIAVAYGYGTIEELEAAKPKKIAMSVKELQEILLAF